MSEYLTVSITRIDSDIYRGNQANIEQSSYVAINPNRTPGGFVFGGAKAARDSLGGQVACRLSLDSFSDSVLEFFYLQSSKNPDEFPLQVLENAFRAANTSVYQFGHSMAAGGRMASSLIGMVIYKGSVAVGRVGSPEAYLVREGECFPFFEQSTGQNITPTKNNFIGCNSLVQVELSSIAVLPGDVLLAFSSPLISERISEIGDFFRGYDFVEALPASDLCKCVFPDLAQIHFAMVAHAGADTIYLSEVVE